ncbi:dioxygenase [Mycobacterium sp. 1245852.3]|uniref:dioxygenase family protein n=1 Tax=Mycobacterium sp. 1245852.3 TaxID=1856860 RepID=UPI0008000835|nr:dioxygenase [Mycobacterium sp. 1245852.3]OBJ83314.1 catechol 1,2-dioxygenase [Mycobacterium sp. 1245852.3]
MIISDEKDVTRAAMAVMDQTTDPRLREIMRSAVRHLHAFVREVHLSEKEFQQATALVNEIGQASNDAHNEAVLMAGSLGISTLVCLVNNCNDDVTETQQSLLGPFWRMQSPRTESGGTIVRSSLDGPELFVDAKVIDQAGNPIADAEVDVWHSSPQGLYDNQDPNAAPMNLRGKFTTDADGRIWFRTVKMSGYPIPTDGVVGKLLAAQNRHPYRPAHLHFLIYKQDFKTMISQIYVRDDPNLDSDVQFGVTHALVGDLTEHPEPHPTDPQVRPPWFSLHQTFVMRPGTAELPRPPIT